MNVRPDTEIRVLPTTSEFPTLPPITVTARSGAFWLQTYWTAEEARGFAAQLIELADSQ